MKQYVRIKVAFQTRLTQLLYRKQTLDLENDENHHGILGISWWFLDLRGHMVRYFI
ncbi:hypothetical protein [Anaerobacillus alkaliphilus]|uniref:hypothetical protein n=1 Tax=Anaerobacillus alkaliphilus TaxID=1548597 RepID=UPI00137593A0|nr:hypothetical protein [Anaerobacillus alkaliphilus]